MANELIPFFDRATQVTGTATVAVTGKRFVRLTANRGADGTFQVGPPAAGGRVFGIATQDAAIGKRVTIIRNRGEIVPATTGAASGAMAVFAEVQVDATGAIIPLAAGVAVGYLVDGTAGNGADAMLSIY